MKKQVTWLTTTKMKKQITWLPEDEAAKMFGWSARHLRKLVKSNTIHVPTTSVNGRRIKYSKEHIDQVLLENSTLV